MSAPRFHLKATQADLKRLAKLLEAQRAKREQARQRDHSTPPEHERQDPTP